MTKTWLKSNLNPEFQNHRPAKSSLLGLPWLALFAEWSNCVILTSASHMLTAKYHHFPILIFYKRRFWIQEGRSFHHFKKKPLRENLMECIFKNLESHFRDCSLSLPPQCLPLSCHTLTHSHSHPHAFTHTHSHAHTHTHTHSHPHTFTHTHSHSFFPFSIESNISFQSN